MDHSYAKKLANPSKTTSLSTSVFGFFTLMSMREFRHSLKELLNILKLR
jgi:hypothetical protein